METDTHYTSVGIFTISILLLASFAIYWLSRNNQYDKSMSELIIRIPGSVNGLSVNSSVRFNGIQIGSITKLSIDEDEPMYSLAKVHIRSDSPIYPSTIATIGVQGLTGMAYIELSTAQKEDKNVFQIAEETQETAFITANPSGMNNLLSSAEGVLNKVNVTSDQIRDFIGDVRKPLTVTAENFETMSTTFSQKISHADQILGGMKNLLGNFNAFIDKISDGMKTIDKLTNIIDTKKIDAILNNAEITSANLVGASNKAGNTIDGIQRMTQTFQTVGQKTDRILSNLSSAIDSQKISSSLENISETTLNARKSISSIQNITEDLAGRRQKMILTIDNIAEMANHLNRFSIQFEEILSKIKQTTSIGGKNSLIEEAHQTLQSLKETANMISTHVPPIADNFQNFSNNGLRNLQDLIADTQQSVNYFSDVLDNFEHNPQQIFLGTESAKQYRPKH
ncbi:MlaD family protein [Candidatus Liberibacter sp.]|uniref:MlaD family protein n=1 Tax=Candidatus Liberibacter sp. TaxID=34022 RepID=UPI0015F4C529|nr:MlaD family protein [Candidatus Liberibacter sp.]MBA5724481.1 MCE family protein [Candidatus Liberibacter sp.]